MNIADVHYTYIGANSTSIADCVLDCSIVDNHLHSDHVPVKVTFDIDVVLKTVLERTNVTRVAWHRANNDHIGKYKTLSHAQCCDKLIL